MVEALKNYIWPHIAKYVYSADVFIARIVYKLQYKEKMDYFNIPIFINNYNRLNYLVDLIGSLEKRGYKNIHIIDNDSSYRPLLDYYESCPYEVIKLKKNIGYLSIWKTDIYKKIKHSYYVYTDSDILLGDDCPDDFMEYFVNILERYKTCYKVGFALSISDIPDFFAKKNEVIEHEIQFWSNEIEKDLYNARIDTTFALYRPYCKGPSNSYKFAIRVGGKYTCRHQPWYVDTQNPPQEEIEYIRSIKQSTHWSAEIKNIKP